MKTFIALLSSILLSTNIIVAQFGHIISPPEKVPHNLIENHAGVVHLVFHISHKGEIINWEISSIMVWKNSKNKFDTQYLTKGSFYIWNEKIDTYELIKGNNVLIKMTRLGKSIEKKLTPWLVEYVKKSRFVIADTSSQYKYYKQTGKRYASNYGGEVWFNEDRIKVKKMPEESPQPQTSPRSGKNTK